MYQHSLCSVSRHRVPFRRVISGVLSTRRRKPAGFVLGLLVLVLLMAPAAALAAPESQSGIYVVRPGDTLSMIAARMGVSTSVLARTNGIANADFVYVGQRLVIPDSSTSAAAPAPVTSSGAHIVQRGETLAIIAGRYGVTVSALARANGIANANFVYSGQRLVIPGRASAPAPAANPAPAPEPAPAPAANPAPAPTDGVYVVRPGDTLNIIAQRFGTTVRALMSTNRLSNANFIYVGQRLAVGAKTASPAPSEETKSAPSEEARSAPSPSVKGKWIDVDLSAQRLTAYEDDKVVLSTLISGGTARTPTVVGKYTIRTKLPAQTMSGPGYWLPNVPYVMYFYAGYAIHGTYWHNNFGHPMSHGCVNMQTSDAAWLYEWAPVGTPVVTHW